MENRLATRGQIGRIVAMLVSGEIRFSAAQMIIGRRVPDAPTRDQEQVLVEALIYQHEKIITSYDVCRTLKERGVATVVSADWLKMTCELLGISEERYHEIYKRVLG